VATCRKRGRYGPGRYRTCDLGSNGLTAHRDGAKISGGLPRRGTRDADTHDGPVAQGVEPSALDGGDEDRNLPGPFVAAHSSTAPAREQHAWVYLIIRLLRGADDVALPT